MFNVLCSTQLGHGLFHEEPLPYLVHQPLPWQVQYVTQSRRTSRDSEVGLGPPFLPPWLLGLPPLLGVCQPLKARCQHASQQLDWKLHFSRKAFYDLKI